MAIILFFFNDTATTEIYTYDTLFPYTTLFRSVIGFVVTFDEITQLLAAQRKAAWSDIARRIAHEIKNPLTPIQLAAERLKRKYVGQITSDAETFQVCTDTIVRDRKSTRLNSSH